MDAQTTTALERRQIAAAKEATLSSASLGILGLRGKYTPSDPNSTESSAGTVYLYRDSGRSIDKDRRTLQDVDITKASGIRPEEIYTDETGTTLCILAVPSHMTPSDLLGWFGEGTMELVTNVRLVKTSRLNRYMVLLKFRNPWSARQKRRDWAGRLFSSSEPETCHIVSVKSIRFETPTTSRDPSSFPNMNNDPFIPAITRTIAQERSSDFTEEAPQISMATSGRPAQPVPLSTDLPTCPVCLDRMDESTGLATIFCQHVFHCACLQKWQGSGCPVCRYTQDDHMSRSYSDGEEDQCRTCGLTDNLWICLICGHLGCGRYDEAHAFAHFQQTSHTFAMDVKTQAIWDYINDDWVHRLIQNKAENSRGNTKEATKPQEDRSEGTLSKSDLEDMSFEYAGMLKAQLDSQRTYYEEQVDRAEDRVAQATAAADQATASSLKANERLDAMEASHQMLLNETLPGLDRGKEKAERRSEKFEDLARKMEKEYKEKEVVNESLMDRIDHLEKQLNEATMRGSELEEQNRDLSFFISGMEKLKDQGADVQEGTLQVADPPKKKKGKNKK